ncbi:MAG TPA: DUF4838 domain-containing protein, partial [Armatimonadetes bacterium]|nr:DUF4838 domain-containing protein [Armatimonadota bacterium]
MRISGRGRVALPGGAGETLKFAASELARYLRRITGRPFEVDQGAVAEGTEFCILTSKELSGDEFRITVGERGCSIEGGSERACLYGVYELLERFLGCKFVLPGEEVVPFDPSPLLPEGRWSSKPAFGARGIVEDAKHVPEDDPHSLLEHKRSLLSVIDWMGKRKLNRYFPGSKFPKAVIFGLLPEFRKRGIELEGGGHHLPLLLPRSLFEERPYLFRQSPEGERVPAGNLCPSSGEALDIVARNAFEAVVKGPKVCLYHLWAEDLPGGGWCSCPECKALSPSDQYLAVVNHVARKFLERGLEVPVDFLAYHDTLDPPRERPEGSVWLTFAPRERCYAHPLDSDACPRNIRYFRALRGLLQRFSPERAVAFEYYGDSLLWGSVGVACPSTVCADLSAYRALSLFGLQCLIFGLHSFWAYGPNLYAFSVTAWEGEAEVERVLGEFCGAVAPGREADCVEALLKFERAVAPFLTYGDIKSPGRPKPDCLEKPLA